jgi:lysine/ornithine N-monooxygenase
LLKDQPIGNYENYVQWARKQFEDCFNLQIRNILLSFQEDQVIGNDVPFW